MTSDNHKPHTETNAPLATRVANTLDNSLEQLDDATLSALTAARQNALSAKKLTGSSSTISATNSVKLQRIYRYGLPAIAAALLLGIVTPSLMDYWTPQPATVELSYFDVDPEMLEVMDLLLVLGELAEEDADAM